MEWPAGNGNGADGCVRKVFRHTELFVQWVPRSGGPAELQGVAIRHADVAGVQELRAFGAYAVRPPRRTEQTVRKVR